MSGPSAGDPDRETRLGSQECACGHLRASHRAQGCAALVQPDQRGQAVGFGFCACRGFRAAP